jgi:energy-coupling factor transport system substrate-specific component
MTTLAATSIARTTNAIRLRPRSAIALTVASVAGVVAFAWPFLLRHPSSSGVAHSSDAPWIFLVVLPLLLLVVLAEISEGGIDAKAIALLGVLAACGAALRTLGGDVTGASPVFFLLMPAGRVLGRGFGFTLGALTLFGSALLTGGVGPWLPFQMLAAGWVGLFAGFLPRASGRVEVLLLAAYGALAGLVYGAVTDLWFWPFTTTGLSAQIAYLPGESPLTNLHNFWAFYLTTSLGFDIPRALANAVLVLVAGRPVLLALRRAARKAAFDVPVRFEESR